MDNLYTDDDITGEGGAPNDGSTSPGSEEVHGQEDGNLRGKITAQAEEIKALKESNQRLEQRIYDLMDRISQAPSSNGTGNTLTPEQEIEALAAEVEEKGDKASLAKLVTRAIQIGEERTISRISPELSKTNARGLEADAKEFFEDKGVPDMAGKNSTFWRFAQQASRDDPLIRAAWAGNNYKRALKVTWDAYVEEHGDPSPARRNAVRRESILSDAQDDAVPPSIQAMLDKAEGMVEIDAILKRTGHYDRLLKG